MNDACNRMLPELDDTNRFFWQSGKDGKLRFLQCECCAHYVHPPAPVCSNCLSTELSPQIVSGKGHIASFTVNHHPWNPAVETPYIIALVELDEQENLRLTTNLVDCDPESVRIGDRVSVRFTQCSDIYLPLFALADTD